MEKDNMITEAIERTTVSHTDDYERIVKEIEDWSDKLLFASIAVSNLPASQFNNCRNDIAMWMSSASKTIDALLEKFENEYAIVNKLMEERDKVETYMKECGIEIKTADEYEAENEAHDLEL